MSDRPDYARLIAGERAAIREALETLTPEQWELPSLCEGWSIRNVAAHLASGQDMTAGRLVATLLAAGFSVDRTNSALVLRWTMAETPRLLEAAGSPRVRGLLRLMPAVALSEAFIHGQDIRRPLGIDRNHPPETLRAVAEATCTRQLSTGARDRVRGLRLVATDIGWSHGDGPEVTGRAEALIMAANGRRVALDDCAGEGLETLASR